MKRTISLTESDIQRLVMESVSRILNEDGYNVNNAAFGGINGMAGAQNGGLGTNIMNQLKSAALNGNNGNRAPYTGSIFQGGNNGNNGAVNNGGNMGNNNNMGNGNGMPGSNVGIDSSINGYQSRVARPTNQQQANQIANSQYTKQWANGILQKIGYRGQGSWIPLAVKAGISDADINKMRDVFNGKPIGTFKNTYRQMPMSSTTGLSKTAKNTYEAVSRVIDKYLR